MFNIITDPAAIRDISEAAEWYDNERRGLGDEFISIVEHTMSFIGEYPLSFPKTIHRYRKAQLRRFPFSLFYYILSDQIILVGCLHHSRDVDHLIKDRA